MALLSAASASSVSCTADWSELAMSTGGPRTGSCSAPASPSSTPPEPEVPDGVDGNAAAEVDGEASAPDSGVRLVTTIRTSAVAECPPASVTVYVNRSLPVKPGDGV